MKDGMRERWRDITNALFSEDGPK